MDEKGSSRAAPRLLALCDAPEADLNPDNFFAEVRRQESEDFKPDIIRCDPAHAAHATDLGNRLGVPVVLYGFEESLVLKNKRDFHAIARGEYEAQKWTAAPARVVTVHEPVDRDLFDPGGEVANGPDGSPKILLAGDCTIQQVNEATAICKRQSGLALKQLEDQLAPVELARWLRWADALLVPCVNDNTARLLARALACGTPCIAPRQPAACEIITDGWDGLLFDTARPLAGALLRLADPSTLARLAAPARTSSERFDLAAVRTREAGVYRVLLKKDWPLISVVLPEGGEIALTSVLGQDYPELEVIVVGEIEATDPGVREVVLLGKPNLSDPRVRSVACDSGNLADRLNAGFKEARGVYLTWLQQHNALEPGALMALARELELDASATMVYADGKSASGTPLRAEVPEHLEEQLLAGGAFLYRAEAVKRIGEYDRESADAACLEYWLRMRRQATIRYLPRPLSRWLHATVDGDARLRVLQREFGDSPDWPRIRFEHYLQMARHCRLYGGDHSALRYAWRAIRMKPCSGAAWRALFP
ncbi:MAG: glycosyltransferase [Planctomycetes bacterium]|nr:glycosyltransferase [Planctomycetota bacterium]